MTPYELITAVDDGTIDTVLELSVFEAAITPHALEHYTEVKNVYYATEAS
jgi:hypothetical protein